MNIDEYQRIAKDTMQFHLEDDDAIVISILGLSGELGELATEFKKKFRDGASYHIFRSKLVEEMGDIFWYLSSIASINNVNLSEVLQSNIDKTRGRWLGVSSGKLVTIFDKVNSECQASECWPRKLTLDFREETGNDQHIVVRAYVDGKQFGDDLRDNNYMDDYYRYHDIFHFSYAAYLGWSPVVRKFLGKKRKSSSSVDEVEDGGRALVIDEAISVLVFESARDHSFYDRVTAVDEELLHSISSITAHLEVSNVSLKSWEEAILAGFKVWREVRVRRNASITFDFVNRSIEVLG
jgi:NTP pyrophosphatase (non-canonical NTP hydrolase)